MEKRKLARDTQSLPDFHIIAAEIIEYLQAALAQFAENRVGLEQVKRKVIYATETIICRRAFSESTR
jgi:hypothetical protein